MVARTGHDPERRDRPVACAIRVPARERQLHVDLVPRDDACLQCIDGAHVPVLTLPHLVEIRPRAIAGVLGHRDPARCHEDVRVVQCLERTVRVAGVEGREEIQDRLAGPAHELGALVGIEAGRGRRDGAKLHAPAAVSLRQDVEHPGAQILCSVGPVAAKADLRMDFLGRRPDHGVRVEIERAPVPPVTRPHLVKALRKIFRSTVDDQRSAARHRDEWKVQRPAQIGVVRGVPLGDERLQRLFRRSLGSRVSHLGISHLRAPDGPLRQKCEGYRDPQHTHSMHPPPPIATDRLGDV